MLNPLRFETCAFQKDDATLPCKLEEGRQGYSRCEGSFASVSCSSHLALTPNGFDKTSNGFHGRCEGYDLIRPRERLIVNELVVFVSPQRVIGKPLQHQRETLSTQHLWCRSSIYKGLDSSAKKVVPTLIACATAVESTSRP